MTDAVIEDGNFMTWERKYDRIVYNFYLEVFDILRLVARIAILKYEK
jgi:hypothetical protein